MTLSNDLLSILCLLSFVRTGIYVYEAWRRFRSTKQAQLAQKNAWKI